MVALAVLRPVAREAVRQQAIVPAGPPVGHRLDGGHADGAQDSEAAGAHVGVAGWAAEWLGEVLVGDRNE
eukprot:4906516-Lingulodinium_polyedra.AAC.1